MRKLFIIVGLVALALGIYLYVSIVNTDKAETKNAEVTPTGANPTAIPTIAPKTVSDDELIKAALVAKNNWKSEEFEVKISKNDGKYATGGIREVGSDTGGGYFFAAKVGDEWKIVADGNGVIPCENLQEYPDYPKSLIPECFDSKTGKSVIRND